MNLKSNKQKVNITTKNNSKKAMKLAHFTFYSKCSKEYRESTNQTLPDKKIKN